MADKLAGAGSFPASAFAALVGNHGGTPTVTAQDKAKLAGQLAEFLARGCPEARFTKALYGLCAAVYSRGGACMDKGGFYAEHFADAHRRHEYLKHLAGDHAIFGDPRYTYSDVALAVRDWIVRHPTLMPLYAHAEQEERDAENEREAHRALSALPGEVRERVVGDFGRMSVGMADRWRDKLAPFGYAVRTVPDDRGCEVVLEIGTAAVTCNTPGECQVLFHALRAAKNPEIFA